MFTEDDFDRRTNFVKKLWQFWVAILAYILLFDIALLKSADKLIVTIPATGLQIILRYWQLFTW